LTEKDHQSKDRTKLTARSSGVRRQVFVSRSQQVVAKITQTVLVCFLVATRCNWKMTERIFVELYVMTFVQLSGVSFIILIKIRQYYCPGVGSASNFNGG
jgi:hypothetical protein